MSSYENFQSDNAKHTKDRHDIYNPDFESPVQSYDSKDAIDKNLSTLIQLASKWKFYPDRFYDSIKPKKGGIEWSMYQRIMMRSLTRFKENYHCAPRGCAKTLVEVAAQYAVAIHSPNIKLSITASTKESSVKIWKAKHDELLQFYPALKDEIKSASFTKDSGIVEFHNGAIIDNLANSFQSNGLRRNRGFWEEAFLLNKHLCEMALEPIFNVPRYLSSGKSDPMELNHQISRFTTSGWKNSDEYEKINDVWDDMLNLKGSFVFGCDWRVPVHANRQKKSIIDKARRGNLMAFQMNYCCRWVGATTGALVDVTKLATARTLKTPQLGCPRDKRGNFLQKEYILGVDVARSEDDSNNKTAIVVLEVIRSNSGEIRQIHCVNFFTPPAAFTFEEQSVAVKRVFYQFGGNMNLNLSMVKAIVVDANVIGKGLVDALLKENTDEETNKELGAFATINTTQESKDDDAPEIVYALTAQGINGDMIREFSSVILANKLKLVVEESKLPSDIPDEILYEMGLACDQTDAFVNEVANLKVVKTKNGKDMTVERVAKKLDKDRYSAVLMGNYYIQLFMQGDDETGDEYDFCIDVSTT